MIIEFEELVFNVLLPESENPHNKIPIVFLHGYTGNANDWQFVIKNLPERFFPIAIDLIGHGKSSSPDEVKKYTAGAQIIYLEKILNELEINSFILVGYSMGGRFALTYAMKHQAKIIALVLESTAFGYKTTKEKEERILSDKKLSEQIKGMPLKDFFEFWYDAGLFNSLRKSENIFLQNLKQEKSKSNNKTGLANSLIGFGTGTMKNYFPVIKNFSKNVLLITGELDTKFTKIATEAKNIFPNAEHKIISNCGHNVHLEKPEEFIKFLNRFLLNIKEEK